MQVIRSPQCYRLNLLQNTFGTKELRWGGAATGLSNNLMEYWHMGLYTFPSKLCDVVHPDMSLLRTIARSIFAAALLYFLYIARPNDLSNTSVYDIEEHIVKKVYFLYISRHDTFIRSYCLPDIGKIEYKIKIWKYTMVSA